MEIAPGPPADTTADAWSVQVAALRRMTGEQRIAVALRLARLAREANEWSMRSIDAPRRSH